MVTEPKIKKSELTVILEGEYNFKVANLTFVPKGECSWSYIVITEEGKKYFLKIHGDKKISPERFKFLSDLCVKCGIKNITYPILTKSGKEEIIISDYPSVLFNFIDGHNAHEQKLLLEQQQQSGKLLFYIHNSKLQIGDYPIREKFDIPFRDDFLKVFEEIKEVSSNSDSYKQELKEMLERNKARITQEFEELEKLQDLCRGLDIEYVNCHGDPTPGNILIDTSGDVYLIDWDDVIFAPKEKDLVFFTSEKYKFVLEEYSNVSGGLNLNETVIDFYNHRWNVGEIADYGTRILFYEEADQQVKHHLEELNRSLADMGLS